MRAQAASFDTRMVNDAVIDLKPPTAAVRFIFFSARVNGSRTDGSDVPASLYTVRAKAVVLAVKNRI